MQHDLRTLAQTLIAAGPRDGVTRLGIGDAVILRRTGVSDIEGMIYQPLLCMILQGAKDVTAGRLSVHCPAGHAIVVSHDLPVLSRITQASADLPYIALILPLDLGVLRGFYDQMPDIPDEAETPEALTCQPVPADIADAVGRLLVLAGDTRCAALLEPILLREIHARLLVSAQGSILRRFLRRDDPSNHLARAIASIRASIEKPISISALAEQAGMSKSSFHAHFKAVTGQTPGQYQKDIRLLEARRLILESSGSISSVGFDVGYESPAQFSRDYARKFGRPPRADRAIARQAIVETMASA